MQRGSVQALCVGRHAFLSDHLGRLFGELGLTTTCAVGIEGARAAARRCRPDLVICDYDLLATGAGRPWGYENPHTRVPQHARNQNPPHDQ